MTLDTTPRSEERAARQRVRAIQLARTAKAKLDGRRRAVVIRGSFPSAREGLPLPDHAEQHARGPACPRRRVHRRPVGMPHARHDPSEARAMSATEAGRDSPRPILAATRAPRDRNRRRCHGSTAVPDRRPGRRRAGFTGPPTHNPRACTNPAPIPRTRPRRGRSPSAGPASARGKTPLAVADDPRPACRRDAPRRADLRAARRMERAHRDEVPVVHGGINGFSEPPRGLRMTASTSQRQGGASGRCRNRRADRERAR